MDNKSLAFSVFYANNSAFMNIYPKRYPAPPKGWRWCGKRKAEEVY